jgi:NADH:ubiquinone oxidoreductase subunit F (NADH-binding)
LRLYEIVSQISEGRAVLSDLDLIQKISEAMSEVSNCGLGQTASTAMRDILKYFREEVEAHITEHICPVGVCPISEHSLELNPVPSLHHAA